MCQCDKYIYIKQKLYRGPRIAPAKGGPANLPFRLPQYLPVYGESSPSKWQPSTITFERSAKHRRGVYDPTDFRVLPSLLSSIPQ